MRIKNKILLYLLMLVFAFVCLILVKVKKQNVYLSKIDSSDYFIMSDQQQSFDELKNGIVDMISDKDIVVTFNIDIDKIQNVRKMKFVRMFYVKGKHPLKASVVMPISKYGVAVSEPELFKLKNYIEGEVDYEKKEIHVYFQIINSMTYQPEQINEGDRVDVYYSQGLLKPPMIRRIIKTNVNNPHENIIQSFEIEWFKKGYQKLWSKISHNRGRLIWELNEAEKLFEIVCENESKKWNISKDKIVKVVKKRNYIYE